ncbi:hypothetical protein GB937_004735 [Aspergillus fischeri]|nr:hypothetical protein GB937_004735 [Aspergillus fischeri]
MSVATRLEFSRPNSVSSAFLFRIKGRGFRFVDYPPKPLPKPIQTYADKKRVDKDDIGDHSNNPQD